MTGDETWIPFFLNETKEKTKEWRKKGESPPVKVKPNRFSKKVMVTVFWDKDGVLLLEFHSSSITSSTYKSTLIKLYHEMIHLRPKKKRVLLLHDNATPHKSKSIQDLIKKLKWRELDHPPYSPDLALSDYYLFFPMKNYLRGINYPNQEEIEFALRDWINKRDGEFFRKGIYDLPRRWRLCSEKKGDYFEKK